MNTIYNNLLTACVICISSKKIALSRRYPRFKGQHGTAEWSLGELELADAIHVTLDEIAESGVAITPHISQSLSVILYSPKKVTPVKDIDHPITRAPMGESELALLEKLRADETFVQEVTRLKNILMILDRVPELVAKNIATKYIMQREPFCSLVDPSICRFVMYEHTTKPSAALASEQFSRDILVEGTCIPCTDSSTDAPEAIRRSVYSEPHVLLFFTDEAEIAHEGARRGMSMLENIYADSPCGLMVRVSPDGRFAAKLKSKKSLTEQTRIVVSVFYQKKSKQSEQEELLPYYEQVAMGYTPRIASVKGDAFDVNVQTYTTPMNGRFMQSVTKNLNTKDCLIKMAVNKYASIPVEVRNIMGDMDYTSDPLLSHPDSIRLNSYIEHLFMGLGMLRTASGEPIDPEGMQTVLASASPFNFLAYSCFTYAKMKLATRHVESLFALAMRCVGWTEAGFISICKRAVAGDSLAQAKMSMFTNLFMRPVALLPYRDDKKYDVVCDQFQCKFDRMSGDCDEGAVAVYYMLAAIMRMNVNIFDSEAQREWARYLALFVPAMANMRIDQDEYINASHMVACLLPLSGIPETNKSGAPLRPIIIETTLFCTPFKEIASYSALSSTDEASVSRLSEIKKTVSPTGFHGCSIPVATGTFYRRFVSAAADLDAYGFTSRMFVLNHDFESFIFGDVVARDLKMVEVAKGEPTKLVAKAMEVVQSCPDIQPDEEKCELLIKVKNMGGEWCNKIKRSIVECSGEFMHTDDGFDAISFTLSLNNTKSNIDASVDRLVEIVPQLCSMCKSVEVDLREDITCNFYILVICK